MDGNFKKIKKEYLIKAFVCAAVSGVFSGLLVVGALLLAFKLCGIPFFWAWYLLVGPGCALLVSGGVFIVMRPEDRRLAEKLDGCYALNEKVQTMVEYAGREGEMVQMQREHTSEILGKIPPKRPGVWELVKFAVVPVLGCALFFTGICIPGNATEEPVEPKPPYNLREIQITQLQSLITDVRSRSRLEQGLRDDAAAELENLLAYFNTNFDDIESGTVTDDDVRNTVLDCIVAVDAVVAANNSCLILCSALGQYESLKTFSTSISNAVIFYKLDNVNILDINKINAAYDASVADGVIESILGSVCTQPLITSFNDKDEAGIKSLIGELTTLLSTAVGGTSYKDSDDGLYGALSALSYNLSGLAGQSGMNADALRNNISEIVNGYYVIDCADALGVQMYNCMADEFVRGNLSRIFGVALPTSPAIPSVKDEDVVDKPGDPDKPGQGGFGEGEIKYGSNDEVLNPDTDEIVKYGSLLDAYYNKVKELISRGEISGDLANYLKQYFDILYSEPDKSVSENN